MNTKNKWLILAAGGIIFRDSVNGNEVLLIHRNRYDDISLPKGKLKDNESFEEAAVREVFEETGFSAKIIGVAAVETRLLDKKTKLTVFFLMQITNDVQQVLNQNTDNEVKETLWVDLKKINSTITYADQVKLILEASKKIA